MTFVELFNESNIDKSVAFLYGALEKVAPTISCSDAFYHDDDKCFTALISDDDELVAVFIDRQDKSYTVEVSFEEDGDDCSDIYAFSDNDDVEEALARVL